MIKSKLRLFGWAVGLSLALGAVGAVAAQGAPVETKAAEVVYKTALFGTSYNSKGVQNYTFCGH